MLTVVRPSPALITGWHTCQARTTLLLKQQHLNTPRSGPRPNLRKSSSTSNPTPRKQVTVTTDDGRLRWRDLTLREKAARSTQQSFNLLIILAGLVATVQSPLPTQLRTHSSSHKETQGAVVTVLYSEVFAGDSATRQFNLVTDRIRKDARCTEVLGEGKDIKAYGEASWSRWQRNRRIA
jgi:mitochondrial import inner membrane translocase subunit TIM21